MKTRFLTGIYIPAFLILLFCSCSKNPVESEAVLLKGSNDGQLITTENATCVGAITATLNGTFHQEEVPGNSYFAFYYSSECSTANELLKSAGIKVVKRDEENRLSIMLTTPNLQYGKTYHYMATITIDGQVFCGEVKSFTTQLSAGPAVDMGLSVKWATCNVGASKPEEPGGFYQWAGTKDVTDKKNNNLSWTNCPYHVGKDYKSGWSKYITSSYSSYWSASGSADNKTVLDPADDIAHVKLGGKWRMPTYNELMELKDNCTATWITINDKPGYIFTSKKPGYTGSCIFMPAAGWRLGKDLVDVGTHGYYWASTINDDTDWPVSGSLFSFVQWSLGSGYHYRYYAYSVRAVQK